MTRGDQPDRFNLERPIKIPSAPHRLSIERLLMPPLSFLRVHQTGGTSQSVGAYTVTLESTNDFHIDITSFISELAAGDRANYGLIAYGDLLGDANIRLPENLGSVIENSATVRIVYK